VSRRKHRYLLSLATLALLPTGAFAASPAAPAKAIDLVVDARDTGRGILHAHETFPVHAGEIALVYPEWIPGEHGPTGTTANLGGLRVTADGKPLSWRRDSADMYQVRVSVPAGVTAMTVDLDVLAGSGGAYSAGGSSSPNLLDLSWNQVLLYPRGSRASAVKIVPHLTLPEGWSYATALSTVHGGSAVDFAPTTLETLIDSPVITSRYLANYDLGTVRGAPHALSVVSDSAETVVAPPELVDAWKRLVLEATALFGARHYDSYRFLVTASEHVDWFGLEHHQSSDNREKERALLDPGLRRTFGELLAHEYAHSWNGKYRRPRGLATPDYQQPMRGDLLWVYEGLTRYLGWVLAVRSGLLTEDDGRGFLAQSVMRVDVPGRTWRPLIDTAVGAQLNASGAGSNASLRRGADYYDEGLLIWLEADVIIRQATGGARSLDDFCQRFHGGKDSSPAVRPYDLAEVVRTLNEVAPHDWKGFFDTRVYQLAPQVPVAGIEGAGYRVVYSEKKPGYLGVREKAFGVRVLQDSLGFTLGEHHKIGNVIAGGPAATAGVTAGMTLVAIDGRAYSGDVLDAALARAKGDGAPLEVIVERDDFYRTLKIDWKGGQRFRVVERDPSRPDLLEKIFAPRGSTRPPPPPPEKADAKPDAKP
jgi:predicted metalloprotease with PDZ domain